MVVIINGIEYSVHYEENETTRCFKAHFPQEYRMAELNGNEKYVYMDYSLPAYQSCPKHINAGDIMLFGDDCLVIFYKSFKTFYSYTRMGHIDNLPELGKGSITAYFE
ncbi:MAG: hypothetical protein IJ115_01765 [Erysipelotrichaceae bacterium]|nr:hypothetical protein [Erysipelotrichaceae bacterium]